MRAQVLATIVVLTAASAEADNWPQWRGPSGTGVSAERGLPTRWSATENVAWRAPLGGAGVSSPIVWGDRVFVTSQIGAGARRQGLHPALVQGGDAAAAGERTLERGGAAPASGVRFALEAFGRTDGKRLWQHTVAADGELYPVHDKHNLASASAVTDGEMVYALFGTGQLVAVDVNGKPAWSRHLGKEYSAFAINWGHASSPTLVGDTIVVLCYHEPAAYLLALDKKTGAVRWKKDREPGVLSYSTPLLVQTPTRAELIVNSSEAIEAYDPSTGEFLWRAPEPNRFPIPMPVYHDGMLYASRGYRSGPYMAIRTGGRGDVTATHVRWRVATGAPYVSSLVFYEGLVYMASELGIVTCIDAGSGERVWRERVGGVFTASPVAGDGKIYLTSESGETIVLRAGRTFEVLSRNQVGDHLVASPAISQRSLFLRGDDSLIAIRQ